MSKGLRMKLVYALWGTNLADSLRSPELRSQLAAMGATALQVNIRDADVADAQMQISTYDQPVAAVVSVWTEGDSDPVTEALGAIGSRIDGWIVDEREPLVAPAPAEGTRYDALANVALLRIPEGLEREQWLRHWQDVHTTVAIETQSTFGYVQNAVVEAITRGPRVDAVVEELFPMAAMTDWHAFWGSGGDEDELRRRAARMAESTTVFGANRNVDVVPTSRYRYDLTTD